MARSLLCRLVAERAMADADLKVIPAIIEASGFVEPSGNSLMRPFTKPGSPCCRSPAKRAF